MVIVLAVKRLNVQGYSRILRKCVKPLAEKLCVHVTDFPGTEGHAPNQDRPTGDVDGDTCQRLVHRHGCIGIASDTAHIAKGLPERLAKSDAHIFRSMVEIDMEIAGRLDGDIEKPVTRELIEHMVQKSHARLDVGATGSVERHNDRNVRFPGFSSDFRFAHGFLPTGSPLEMKPVSNSLPRT